MPVRVKTLIRRSPQTLNQLETSEKIAGMLLGLAVGDALGVPVEFMSRDTIRRNPVKGMRGYGTHQQPPGTWSDDASLTFCLADALLAGESDLLARLATNMVGWQSKGDFTAHGHVFDIGVITAQAIRRIQQGVAPERAGGRDEFDNGNGSLMRVLPLLLLLLNKPTDERFDWVRRVSGVTHGHLRSVMACFYYLELARLVWQGLDKHTAYVRTNEQVGAFWTALALDPTEQQRFGRLLGGRLTHLPAAAIQSGGYVLDTLEASVWCWLTTDTYGAAVLKAVNLGDDTDTTGAVTGGLAGLYYGVGQIPAEWLACLARLDTIRGWAAGLNPDQRS